MRKWIVIIGCILVSFMDVKAQCTAMNEAIRVGEKLTYELKFNWKFIWVNAGEAKMDLAATTYKG